MDADPPLDALDLLLDELDESDPEHPDVAVSHESGWTLSAFPSGRLIYENAEDESVPVREMVATRTTVLTSFRALAVGDLDALESQAWTPYNSGDIAAR